MRFSTSIVLTALAGIVVAQTSTGAPNLNNLPACAGNCVGNSLSSTGCSQFDITCICKSSQWISGLSCCISQACSPADQQATIQYAQSICDTVQVTVPSAAGCSSGSTSGAASTAAPSGSSSATAKTTTAAGSSSATGSATSKAGAAPTGDFSPAGLLAMGAGALMMAL